MRLQRAEPLGLFELMVRPKNSARASRTNGAKATNKGKAKKLVPVLVHGHDARAGGFEVRTQGRAQLPKGYFAYASELAAQMTCVMYGRREAYEAENKDGQLPHLVDVAADEVTKLQKDAKEKGWDAATRMAKLKEITKGAKETFVFKEEAAEQPRRRPHRGSRSARSR